MIDLSDLSAGDRARLAAALLARRAAGEDGRQDASLDPAPSGEPVLADAGDDARPFPLSAIQQAYWMGRKPGFELAAPSRAFVALRVTELDPQRLESACNRLLERHPMLRVVIDDNGEQHVPAAFSSYRLRNVAAAERDNIREVMLSDPEAPLLDVRWSIDAEGAFIYFAVDLLVADGGSVSLIMSELGQFYNDPEQELPPLALSYRAYLLATQAGTTTPEYQRSAAWWQQRAHDMPAAPALPLARQPVEIEDVRFIRRQLHFPDERWQVLSARSASLGVSQSALLLAVYAEVLATWSQTPEFTINIPTFNRRPLHDDIEKIVGPFTSIGLHEVRRQPDDSFSDRLLRHQERLLLDLEHRDYDGVDVMRELVRMKGDPEAGRMPVVFTSLLEHGFDDAFSALGDIVDSVNQTAQVWMDLHADLHEGDLLLKLDTVAGLFPPGMEDDFLATMAEMLARLAETADWDVPWPITIPPAQQLARDRANATTREFELQTLDAAIFANVATQPDSLAVVGADESLTYAQLGKQVQAAAAALTKVGVVSGDRVAVCLQKSTRQVVAVLGILRCGAAYVPLDPDAPDTRLMQILKDAAVSALVTTRDGADLADCDAPRVFVDENLPEEQGPAPAHQVSQLAYVIFTSGSTGKPKGVMISHANVMNRVLDVNERLGLSPAVVTLGVSALHHDLSVFDVFGTLVAGGTLVLPGHNERVEPQRLAGLIETHGVTFWNSVPAFLVLLVDYLETAPRVPASLSDIVLAGDWIPVDLPARVSKLWPHSRFIASGGPTETTVWDVWHEVTATDPDWRSIPYGVPMANTQYHILDEHFMPRPDWVVGEMFITGAGVGEGYWHDAEKTNAAFLDIAGINGRAYRSGDLGRWLPNGMIEFVGRKDFQLKVRGVRIEAGEVEAALLTHPEVSAVIVDKVTLATGVEQLAAWLVTVPGRSVNEDDLRNFVDARLPAAMVPAFFIVLAEMPLTPNGKLDRRALPPPVMAKANADSGTPGERLDQMQSLVAGIIGATPPLDSNLIALGASSIDLIRVGNAIEQAFGVRPRMDQVFRLRTVRALAQFCDEALGEAGDASADPSGNPWQAIIAAFAPLREAAERDAFKASRPGLRKDLDNEAGVSLARTPAADLPARYGSRRSRRRFGLQPLPLAQFSQLLESLAIQEIAGFGERYPYGSPGGLYPVQLYCHVVQGRIEGLRGGAYYYDPLGHALQLLAPGVLLPRDIHVPFVNTPVADDAAFSLFLVTELAAIAPSYGEASWPFSHLEAGVMAHQLELAAAEAGIAMTQIGGIDFERIREHFALRESQQYVHGLLGGAMLGDAEVDDSQPVVDTAAARLASLLQRVARLDDEQARTLLRQLRDDDND